MLGDAELVDRYMREVGPTLCPPGYAEGVTRKMIKDPPRSPTKRDRESLPIIDLDEEGAVDPFDV